MANTALQMFKLDMAEKARVFARYKDLIFKDPIKIVGFNTVPGDVQVDDIFFEVVSQPTSDGYFLELTIIFDAQQDRDTNAEVSLSFGNPLFGKKCVTLKIPGRGGKGFLAYDGTAKKPSFQGIQDETTRTLCLLLAEDFGGCPGSTAQGLLLAEDFGGCPGSTAQVVMRKIVDYFARLLTDSVPTTL